MTAKNTQIKEVTKKPAAKKTAAKKAAPAAKEQAQVQSVNVELNTDDLSLIATFMDITLKHGGIKYMGAVSHISNKLGIKVQ